ncbi:hypothetical protein J3P85_03980 [Pseudomonas sp. Z1-12]|uniref:hypothetical protein n=1 Tax=Pseudomonas sp. Z1-12 TaxID=2817408 RepID=UPI003DA968E7
MEYGAEYPAPVVTSDDVRVISRYVSEGKLLPLTDAGVKNQINNAPDTLVTELVDHYKIINDHANSWEKVQDGMITIGSVLVAFSQDIHEYGDEAVELVKGMEGYKSRKISELSEDELSGFPTISLDGDDERQMPTLENTVNYIRESISEKKRKSSVALADLDSFKNTLINVIDPWLGRMIQASGPDALDTEISNIRRSLNRLAEDITQTQVEPSFTHKLFDFAVKINPILALMEENKKPGKPGGELIKKREELLNKLATDNQLKGVMHKLYIGIGSLYDVVNPAIKATMQLHSHWENILLLIDDSSNQFRNNASYAYLGLFVRKLEALLADWRSIENNSNTVMNAFRLNIQ